jgi:NADPH:quinone reductase-like Zn-dependent oxidoreductase
MSAATLAPAVPATMRAAVIREHGASDTLRVQEAPTPRPGPDELLIRVGAVGLNHLDVFARQGLKGPGVHPIVLPHVSGVDVAGTIASGPRAGERVLVNPAIGCGACRQCRRGELVLAVAGTEAKRRRACELGAVAAFDSRGDWLTQVLEWTDGEGVDLVHDAVGAPTWSSSIRALAMGGRMVICGATGGDNPDLSIREIYQHHRQILGAPMGNWQDFLNVTRLVFTGQLIPEVYAVYPLERIGEAEDALEDRQHFGKIVVSIN